MEASVVIRSDHGSLSYVLRTGVLLRTSWIPPTDDQAPQGRWQLIPELRPLDTERQGFTQATGDTPAFHLLAEFVRSTIMECLSYVHLEATWTEEEEAVRENIAWAMVWVLEPGLTWPYSIESICDILGLDLDSLRQRIFDRLQMTPAEMCAVIRGEGIPTWVVPGVVEQALLGDRECRDVPFKLKRRRRRGRMHI